MMVITVCLFLKFVLVISKFVKMYNLKAIKIHKIQVIDPYIL